MGFKLIPTLVSVAITLFIWLLIPIPQEVTANAWLLFAMFIGVIAAIIGKAMPIGAISIIAISLVAITRVTSDNPSDAIKDALSGFALPLIWLIGISIMISKGLQKTGLGARLGYYFIAVWGKRTIGIGYSLALSELILAPVTPSNTARGGGIIHPIVRSIATSFDSDPAQGTEGKIGKYLALVNYHANPITSAMFITATAPNPLVVQLIADATGSQITLSWTTWALAMVLPGVVALTIMPLALYLIYPPEIKKTPNAAQFAKDRLKEMGPISKHEMIMMVVFGILLVLWAGIPAMILGDMWSLDPTTTAFIGLSLLLLTGVLTWEDVLTHKSAWDTVTWFAALVMMATFLNKLGLIAWFSNVLQSSTEQMGLSWVPASMFLLLSYMYAHYIFASTTAHITAMFSAFYIAGIAVGAPPMYFALMMAAASSIMMTLTHYATGTSPIIYGSGYTTLGEWWKAGFAMSVINMVIFIILGGIWWKILGYW